MADQDEKLDLIWGAEAIGRALGISERQAKHMLANHEIPGRKVGGKRGRWVASRKKLEEFFEEEPA